MERGEAASEGPTTPREAEGGSISSNRRSSVAGTAAGTAAVVGSAAGTTTCPLSEAVLAAVTGAEAEEVTGEAAVSGEAAQPPRKRLLHRRTCWPAAALAAAAAAAVAAEVLETVELGHHQVSI